MTHSHGEQLKKFGTQHLWEKHQLCYEVLLDEISRCRCRTVRWWNLCCSPLAIKEQVKKFIGLILLLSKAECRKSLNEIYESWFGSIFRTKITLMLRFTYDKLQSIWMSLQMCKRSQLYSMKLIFLQSLFLRLRWVVFVWSKSLKERIDHKRNRNKSHRIHYEKFDRWACTWIS